MDSNIFILTVGVCFTLLIGVGLFVIYKITKGLNKSMDEIKDKLNTIEYNSWCDPKGIGSFKNKGNGK